MEKPGLFCLLAFFSFSFAYAQPSVWKPIGIGGGGAMFSPALNPYNDSDMFIACDMSDLFHSTTNGATWNMIDFRQVFCGPNSKVCFTKNPKIKYTIDNSGNASTPTKTIDGGTTWTHVSGWNTGTPAYNIYTDIQDSLRLLVSDWNSIYYSGDGGKNFNKIYAYTSTAWNQGCYMAGAFFDAANIYVATKSGLLASTDSGKSFSISVLSGIPNTEDFISFCGAKQNGHTRFYCTTVDTNHAYPGLLNLDYTVFKGVYKLELGNSSWASVLGNINTTYQNPMYCGMAQNDTGTVYLAGSWTPPPYVNGNPIIFKSINGSAWQNVMDVGEYQQDGQNQNVYTAWVGYKGDYPWFSSCPAGFSVDALNSNRLAITALGDCYLTENGGTTWHQLYQDTADNNPPYQATPRGKNYHCNGLMVTGCWWLAWTDSLNVFAGYTDIKAVRSKDGGKSWNFDITGDPMNTMYQVFVNPLNNYLYAATSSIHDMYKSTKLTDGQINPGGAAEDGLVLYSKDTGKAWLTLYDFGHPVIRLATDPNNAKKLYAAVIHHNAASSVGGIYVCNDIVDSASTWHLLPAPPRTEGHPYDLHVLKDGSLLCTYSARMNSSTYKFTTSSGVFYWPKGANAWEDRSDANMQYYTKDIIIDQYDTAQNTWYACVNNGWGGGANDRGGLYKTKDRGQTWKRLTPSAEPAVWSASLEGATISPNDKNEMYYTTSNYGLWHTTNLNDSNPVFTQQQEYPFSAPQRVFYNPFHKNEIWVTSFGGGIRTGIENEKTSVIQYKAENAVPSLQVYPNPATGILHIDCYLLAASDIQLTIYNSIGQKIALLANGKFTGKQSFTWNTQKAENGIYLCELKTQYGKQVMRVVVEK